MSNNQIEEYDELHNFLLENSYYDMTLKQIFSIIILHFFTVSCISLIAFASFNNC